MTEALTLEAEIAQTHDPGAAAEPQPAICTYNEWDPLEEAIVGVVEGAVVPEWHVTLDATMPSSSRSFFQDLAGKPFPKELEDKAAAELTELVQILEGEGVRVRRPDPFPYQQPFSTPYWSSVGSLYAAMPRDVFLVVGNDIIEAPMAWRSRYFESHPYRTLLKEYFHRGARWTCAPRPELKDDLYDLTYDDVEHVAELEAQRDDARREIKTCLTEFEPTFDAADFARCGRDIFVQKSNTTNDFGIEWMRRHLGDDYRVHVLDIIDPHPMHLDATFVPLAPGKVLINPDRIANLPPMFDTWDVLVAPRPSGTDRRDISMCSSWISMNVIMIDSERVVVEKYEEPLIRALEDWGFKTIKTSLRHFNAYGGGYHCCTLDVSRRGSLESYF